MIDLPAVLARLSVARPLFHSEADFQHALAWEIQRRHPDAELRLELRPAALDQRAYIDIWVNSPAFTAAIWRARQDSNLRPPA